MYVYQMYLFIINRHISPQGTSQIGSAPVTFCCDIQNSFKLSFKPIEFQVFVQLQLILYKSHVIKTHQ